MHLLLISLGHKDVPVHIREKLSFTDVEVEKALVSIKRMHGIKEALLLSTCNRTELLVHHTCDGQALVETEDVLKQFLCVWNQVEIDDDYFRCYYDLDAVRHLFRVSVGLESLVLGESQILGQVKNAYTVACRVGATGHMLNRLLHRAFRVGKRSRTETKIGMGICSVSHAAAALAMKQLKSTPAADVLIVGAGEMALITAKELAKHSDFNLTIVNRNEGNARTLARHVDGEVLPLDQLTDGIAQADAVITAVGVKEPIITVDTLPATLESTVMIDIGVPRNIAPEVGEHDQISLFSIDDLKNSVDEGLKKRRGEVTKVKAIIDDELDQFEKWFRSLTVEPTIKALITSCEDIRATELDRVSSQFSDDQLAAVEQVTNRIVKKILHNPIRHLKTCHSDRVNTADYWVEMVHAIFDLEVDEAPEEDAADRPLTCPHAIARKSK